MLQRTGPVGGISFATGAWFTTATQGWVLGTLTRYTNHNGATRNTTSLRIVHNSDGGNHWSTQYRRRT